MDLILASTSPFRLQQLQQFGLQPRVCAPTVNEIDLKREHRNLPPREYCLEIARGKLHSTINQFEDAIVIASDQICVFENQIIDKSKNPEAARAQLERMQGKTHELMTALTVGRVQNKNLILELTHVDVCRLEMRPLSNSQIATYVAKDESWNCAGSYKLERSGRALFRRIDSEDESAIIGLPLIQLTEFLLRLGFQLPFLGETSG